MALDGIIGNARLDVVDVDVTDQAATDDVYMEKFNKYYLLAHQKGVVRRLTGVVSVDSGLTTDGSIVQTAIPTDWIEVVSAFIAPDNATVYGTPLEIVRNPADITRLQAANATPAAPKKICFQRRATTVPAEVGRFDVLFYPIPDAAYEIGLLVRKWPILMVNSTDVPDIDDLMAYTLAKLVAAEIAGLIGEDAEFIQHILRDVPDEMMSQMGVPRPGTKKQEEVAA